MKNLLNLRESEKGQGVVEYALIGLAVFAIIVATLFKTNNRFQTAVTTSYNKIASTLTGANTTLR